MTGLSINKQIYKILSNDETLKEYVGEKIYPLIADEDVTFPFITFSRSSITPMYAKNIHVSDTCRVSISVCDPNYTTAVDIAERVREILELYRGRTITEIHMSSCEEYYMYDSYVQRLEFQCTIIK